MKKTRQIIAILLSAVLGTIFIFSAWSKTTPNLQYFETIIHQQLQVPDMVAAIAARFFIGLEAALGIMMLISVYGRKKWVLKACLALLVIFSIHLIILWIGQGSEVDCGCMGTMVAMNVWQSIIKNLILIILVWVLLRLTSEERNLYNHVLAIIVSIVIVVAPYFLYPIGPRSMPMSLLYGSEQPNQPKENLRTGKHIVCFMTLTCPHCRNAARIIHKIHEDNPDFPFYIVFPHKEGDTLQQEKLEDFMEDTKDRNIPYSFTYSETFIEMLKAAGEDGVPTMLWMEDTTINRKMTISQLMKKEEIVPKIQAWLNKPSTLED